MMSGTELPLCLLAVLAVLAIQCSALRGVSAGPSRYLQQTSTFPLPDPACPRTQLPRSAAAARTIIVDGSAPTAQSGDTFNDIKSAWDSLPKGRWTTGVTINVKPGRAAPSAATLSNIWATIDAPLFIQRDPAAGPSAEPAVLQTVQLNNCTHVYFSNIVFEPQTVRYTREMLWITNSENIYLQDVTVIGKERDAWPLPGTGTAQSLKVVQSKGIYVEDSNFYGAAPFGMAVNFIAVQYGHVCRSEVHHAGWCMVITGGSAYIVADSNTVHHCGTSGIAAGSNNGYADMVKPWINYHSYGVKVTNNVINNVLGAGLSIFGSFSVLMAHNTLYKVGSNSHTVEIMTGSMSCPWDAVKCPANTAAGGWGPDAVNGPTVQVPTKDVVFVNNLVVNPASEGAKWSHFSTSAPTINANSPASLTNPVTVTDGLVIRGNVFVNYRTIPTQQMGLGLEKASCLEGSSCATSKVLSENLFNAPGLDITFSSPDSFVLSEASWIGLMIAAYKPAPTAQLPPATWDTKALPVTPPGQLINTVLRDKGGATRSANGDIPGAYKSPPTGRCTSTARTGKRGF